MRRASDSQAAHQAKVLLSGPEHAQLVQNEGHYRQACVHRQVWKGVHRFTLGNGIFCQSTALGFDNRLTLPPFMPLFRAADVTFGQTLRLTHSDALFGYLPSAVFHDPFPVRTDPGEAVWRGCGVLNFQHVHAMLIGCHRPSVSAVGSDERLRGLGRHLVDVASLSLDDFMAFMRPLLLQRASQIIHLLEQRRSEQPEAPSFWVDDLERAIACLQRQVLPSPLPPAPVDLMTVDGDHRAGWRTAQDLVKQYGWMLQAWPTMTIAARTLADRGIRLTRPVREGLEEH